MHIGITEAYWDYGHISYVSSESNYTVRSCELICTSALMSKKFNTGSGVYDLCMNQ